MTQVKPTAWSYSSYAVYETCPLQWKFKYIDKLPEPQTPALANGNRIHIAIDSYLKDTTGRVQFPPEAVTFRGVIDDLKSMNPFGEQKWAFRRDWTPVGYFDKRPAYAPFVRIVLDAGKVFDDGFAVVVDWKTGKKYDTHQNQLSLYAAATFAQYPDVQAIETRMAYLDSGEEMVLNFAREGFDKPVPDDANPLPARHLQDDWRMKGDAMLSDPIHGPTPSYKCKWCHFRKSNGGPCRYDG